MEYVQRPNTSRGESVRTAVRAGSCGVVIIGEKGTFALGTQFGPEIRLRGGTMLTTVGVVDLSVV
jgi:hypothetical protein